MEVLVIDGVRFKPWTPKDEEKEFHPLIRKCSKEIFGEDSIYFDVKGVLRTSSGIESIPDAYVIDLVNRELYVVENELSTHPAYDHIVKQLTKFINSIENLETKDKITSLLYNEISKDIELKAKVQKKANTSEIFHYISELLKKTPKIVVIIDKKTKDIEEACKPLKYQPKIIEFRIFARENAENVQAYLFEPIYLEKVSGIEEKEIKRRSWIDKLALVDDNVREIVDILNEHILGLGDVKQKIVGAYLCFYKGKISTKSIFAAFLLTKKALNVRIRGDPNEFVDREKWTKAYKGWFFKEGQERGFKITSKEQIPYAMELVKQSYNIIRQSQ